MTGDRQYDSLMEYAVGYHLRKFTVHGRVVRSDNSDAQNLRHHVVICMILMKQLNQSSDRMQ